MMADQNRHHPPNGEPRRTGRRSIRLQDFDYSQPGAYFVTICTHNRECLFGEIVDGEMKLNDMGQVVQECWNDLPNHYANIELDQFVVMPNHVHGIIIIMDISNVGAIHESPLPHKLSKQRDPSQQHESPLQMDIIKRRQMLLSKIIGRFKMNSAKRINVLRNSPGTPVWQRNYYEHIIRGERDFHANCEYIIHNPAQWQYDRENEMFFPGLDPNKGLRFQKARRTP